MQVVLVTRQGCHLCDQALALLQELNLHPELLDIEADEELYRLYDWRVPVVLADGVVVAEGKVTRERLLKSGLLGEEGKASGSVRTPDNDADNQC